MAQLKLTIQEAEDAIRRRFSADNFQGELRYDPAKVIETERWWYIPYCWIGCNGFIVSKDNLYVNWLGSALSLEECFWGHEHGVMCDLVDFTFSLDTDSAVAVKLVSKFKHIHPNASGIVPSEPVWYKTDEVQSEVSRQFPTFSRHFVWFCIPELMEACEQGKLRFTCNPSKRREIFGGALRSSK